VPDVLPRTKGQRHFELDAPPSVAGEHGEPWTRLRSATRGDHSQLPATLKVCGTASNAFLNLARSSDLRVRRLLL